ncbi:MAG: hypothetical protein ABIG60_05185 [Patescibacteria group bacterium]
MKSWKIIFVFLVVLAISACAGKQQVEITMPVNNKTIEPRVEVYDNEVDLSGGNQTITNTERRAIYKSKFFGLPAEDPLRVATAQATVEQGMANAELTRAMAEDIRNGKKSAEKNGLNANYLIGFANNDPAKQIHFFNPEIPGHKIMLTPNGGSFILGVSTLPSRIPLFYNDKLVENIYPERDYRSVVSRSGGVKKKFLGRDVDLRYTINDVY